MITSLNFNIFIEQITLRDRIIFVTAIMEAFKGIIKQSRKDSKFLNVVHRKAQETL